MPLSSEEPEASKVTGRPTSAGFGLAVNEAVGAPPAVKWRTSVAPVLPTLSTALICQVWSPSASGWAALAEHTLALQAVIGTSRFFAPSIQSSYWRMPAYWSWPWSQLKVGSATALPPAAGSRSATPVGAVVSTVKLAEAGVGSGGSGGCAASPFSRACNV